MKRQIRSKIIIKIMTLLLLSLVIGLVLADKQAVYQLSADQLDAAVRVTAHRGSSAAAPENTIPAIQLAVQEGADCIEVDIRQTKDGELVLLHDASLDRTTNRSGEVREIAYQDLSGADAGSWFHEDYAGTAVPTLEQALAAGGGEIVFNIEIKDCGEDPEFVKQIAEIIEREGLAGQCLVSSTNYHYLLLVKQLNDKIRVGIILTEYDPSADYEVVDFFSLSYSGLSEEDVQRIHTLGKEVHVWTIEEEGSVEQVLQWGVDNIISNSPDKVIRFRNDFAAVHR